MQESWGEEGIRPGTQNTGILLLGRAQDLVTEGGSDKRLPTFSNCYFLNKYFLFHFGGFDRTTPGSAPAFSK